jgi:hypothetical protein
MVDTSVRAAEKSNEQPEGGFEPNATMMVWETKNYQKMKTEKNKRITYLDSGNMGSLVRLDDCDLLNDSIHGFETGTGKVG